MWDMNTFNVSATLSLFRVLARPSLCLPHVTISTFNDLPIPLSGALAKCGNVDIRVVVLDKDDCFAVPHTNDVYKPYKVGYITFLVICMGLAASLSSISAELFSDSFFLV